ncbi:hypothetical protein QOZ80_5BG0438430 [Eleusine coracana subsp. coracana]|nr:hypothetical protein QOZ80_5BG0438430 [Eleusine coracana subsp. coracana]
MVLTSLKEDMPFMVLLFVAFTALLSPRASAAGWSTGGATWYGDRHGAGTDGGACGYQAAVRQPPFSSMVAAAGQSIFQNGKAAVNATSPVTVVLSDVCPGGPCQNGSVHFDMSGTAFGAMAKRGQADQLLNAGRIQIQYTRVPCNWHGVDIAFRVDSGSNSNYLAVAIEFEAGDGDLRGVELKEHRGSAWEMMQQSWGAVWKYNGRGALRAPFSFRLTSGSGRTLVAANVVPAGWRPGATYPSVVNY